MPYIGRDLNRGNYLKLDDISSSFNSSTKTFNLTVGGSAFTPGSAFSILVSVGGVIQEPESAYQVNNSQITFANAPTAQDGFFCIALGMPISIGVPGNGTVNGTQIAKPFNYDGFFYLNDSSNRVGINSSSPTVALDVIGDIKLNGSLVTGGGGGGNFGIVTCTGLDVNGNGDVSGNFVIGGDLTVNGTTTTLDTKLTEVDRIEVGANSSTLAGIAVTQSGSADLVRLYDGASQVVTVDDTGNVGIGTGVPNTNLHIVSSNPLVRLQDSDNSLYSAMGGESGNLYLYSANNGKHFIFRTNSPSAEIARITGSGRLGIGTHTPTELIDVLKTSNNAKIKVRCTTAGAYFEADSASSGYVGLILSSSGTQRWLMGGYGSNNFTIKDGGTTGDERFTIVDGTGRVGIGTNNPTDLLEVYSTSDPTIRSRSGSSSVGANIEICGGSSNDSQLMLSSGTTLKYQFFRDGSQSDDLRIYDSANSLDIIRYRHGGYLHFGVNGEERLRIKSDGNVGIATANPTNRLSVVDGGIRVYGAATPNINFSPHGGNSGNADISFSASDLKIISNSSGANIRIGAYSKDNHIVIKANGHIGIHTDNPSNSTHLTVAGKLNYEAGIHYQQSNVSLYRFITEGGTGHVYYDSYGINSGNDGDHVFRTKVSTGAQERLRIANDGKVFLHGTGADGSNNTTTRLPNGYTFNIHGNSSEDGISVVRYNAGYGAYGLNIGRSRSSTLGTNTAVVDGDELGHISFYGANGSSFSYAAQITAIVDGEVGTGGDGSDMPGALSFRTTPDASGTPTEKLRIKPDGKIKFATSDSSTDYLEYGSNPRLWLRCPSNMNGLRIDASTTPLQIRNSDATGRTISIGGAPNFDVSISGDYSLSAGEYNSSPTLFFNATRHNGTNTSTSFQTSIKAVATSNTNNTGYLGLGASASPDDLVIKTDGNIGINNTDPQEKLQIAGNISLGNRADNSSRYIGKGTNGDGGVIGDASANGNSCWIGFVSGTGNNQEDQLRFGTHKSGVSGGEKLRIDGQGHLLIPGTQTVSDQTGKLDIYHTSPAEIDSPHIRLWGPSNQDARIEFGSETNVGEGGYISYNDSDEGLYIGSRMSGYSEVNICTGMNDGSPHSNVRLAVNNYGRTRHHNTTNFNREAYTKGGTVYGGGDATGKDSVNPGAYTFVNATPVRGTNTRYSFWVQSGDAYPNASNYIDFTVQNAYMYRVLIKGSHSSATADIAQFLIYGLANSSGNLAPLIEQVTTTTPSFNGDSGGSGNFGLTSGSFSCKVMGYGISGGTRGSTGTYDTTLRIEYSGNNNQGLIAFIERWDQGT